MINECYDRKITAWIEEHREEILQDWMALASIPSVRGEAEPGAPFGKECARMLDAAGELYKKYGFDARVEQEKGYTLGFGGTGEKVIGLFGHGDVVPVGDGWIYTEPFTPIIRDGCLIGRGVSDNKSGVIASLSVMRILRDCGIPFGSRMQTFVGADEESGMQDVDAFAATEVMPDLCLVPDAGFPCGFGEKGILRLWACCDTPLKTVREFKGGNAFNVVLDHVDVVLDRNEALEAQLREKIGENTAFTLCAEGDTIHLTAKGMAKHAGSPDGSVNAALLAAQLLVSALEENDKACLQTVCDYLGTYDGEAMGIRHMDEGFGPLTAANGMVEMKDGKLRLSLDVRYGASLPGKELEEKLHKAWNSRGWTVDYLDNDEGFEADADHPVPKILTQVFNTITGFDAKPFRMSGGTYARHLKNAFSVGAAAGAADVEDTAPEMPAGHGGAHQRDEYININRFFRGLRILTHAVILCDKAIQEG